MELVFIRHGKTKGNLERRYVGRTDEGLLDAERDRLLALAYPKADHVYVSPMKRCIMSAELLYPKVPKTLEDKLKETDFGVFEYHNYEELKENIEYQRWIDSGGVTGFPQGESLEVFQKRCRDGFLKCMQHAHQNKFKRIAFVVHGGTIMAIMDAYAFPHQDYFNWQVSNADGYTGRWNVAEKRIVKVTKVLSQMHQK